MSLLHVLRSPRLIARDLILSLPGSNTRRASSPHLQPLFRIQNKLLIYKAILEPIWTYGIQLWGSTSSSTIDILERFQSEVLRIITDAPWYVPNAVITRDLQVPTVRQDVRTYSVTYRQRITDHPNRLASSLHQGTRYTRRLTRYYSEDLATRFN
jgi:hypothetical protein